MARTGNQSHEPEHLGVPDANIVDLRGTASPETAAPRPAPQQQPTPAIARPQAQKKMTHPPRVRVRLPKINKDYFERMWWQVDLRNIAVFGVLVLVIIGTLAGAQAYGALTKTKGVVLGASTEAYTHLQSAQQAIDQDSLEAAAADFRSAQESFQQANARFQDIPGWLRAVLKLIPGPGTTIKSGEHLLNAGTEVAVAGEAIVSMIQKFKTDRATQAPALPNQETTVTLLPILDALHGDLQTALTAGNNAAGELAQVSAQSVPSAYRSQIALVQQALPAVQQQLNSMESVIQLLTAVLGTQKTKEYLLIFQNNNEVRATGGFIGSLAQIAVHDGVVRVVEVPGKGAYEVNDDFDLTLIPPRPLWLINNKWQIQDANWWPDWPTSAAKITWFYETARGFPISGIVSLTPDVLIDLLRVTGPVDLTDAYGVTVTDENFISTVQDIGYNEQENRPKAIIADLMPIVITRLLNTDAKQLLDTLAAVNTSLTTKQLLLYFDDSDLEAIVKNLGWAGEVREAPADYLSVIHTNIGGGKTDLLMSTEVEHKAELQSDGSIVDTVTIVRRHTGDPNDPEQGIKNMDYVRLYVPEGATLLSASGFTKIDTNLLHFPDAAATTDVDVERLDEDVIVHEDSGTRIYSQFGKTVFANWLGIEAGSTAIANVTYRLPFSLSTEGMYQILLQKQSGTKGNQIVSSLTWPETYRLLQTAPAHEVETAGATATFSQTLKTDRAWGVRLEKTK